MSDRQGLLLAILASPDDDLPRIAYADWLEEHGEPQRAELIRAQVERAAKGDDDPGYARLRRRENALLKAHPEWAQTGLGVVGTLHRGFIEEVSLEPGQLVEIGPQLVERFPIRRVCLRFDSDLGPIRQVAKCPALARVRELRIQKAPLSEGGPGDAGLRAFLGSAHLGRLRALELITLWLTDRTAADLAGAASLGALEALDLRNSRLGPSGLEDLAGAARLRGLKRLCLHRNPIGPAGAEVLANAPWRLEALDLMRAQLQTAGVRSLTATACLERARELSLEWNSLRVQAAQLIGKCQHVAALRSLNFNRNRLEDAGAEALARSPHLAGLTHLGLRRNRLTPAGVMAVGESEHLRNVRTLELGANAISDKQREQLRERFGKRFGRF